MTSPIDQGAARSDRDDAWPGLEVVAANADVCGEGPIWDDRTQRLLWVDLGSSLMYGFSEADRTVQVIGRGLMAASIALGIDGQLVVGGDSGLHLWRDQTHHSVLVSEHDGRPLSINDMVVDGHGRIYAGTAYWGPTGMERFGALYRIDVDGAVHVVDDGIRHANGLGFSPDGRTLYFADTGSRAIYAYDVNSMTGSLSRRRTFVRVPQDDGLPDGLTVDRDGYVWCALWFGSQVVRYDSDGAIERRIKVPATQTSSVAFGGPEWADLFITSAAELWRTPLAPGRFNHASPPGGSLYRARVDVQGVAQNRTPMSLGIWRGVASGEVTGPQSPG